MPSEKGIWAGLDYKGLMESEKTCHFLVLVSPMPLPFLPLLYPKQPPPPLWAWKGQWLGEDVMTVVTGKQRRPRLQGEALRNRKV